jgi:hypothetical protein
VRSAVLIVLAALAGGCTPGARHGAGGDAGPAPSTPIVTLEQYMAATERLYCAYATCTLGFSATEECRVTNDFLAQIEKSLRSGRRRLASSKAAACVEATRTLDGHACWGEKVSAGLSRMVEALDRCDAAASGTLVIGERCYDTAECDGGYCDLTACPGACVPLRAPGSACSDHVECGAGALCLTGAQGDSRCVPLSVRGEACDDGRPCVDALACIGGVCADPEGVSPGAACRGDSDCGFDARCVEGGCLLKSGIGGPCSAGVSIFPSPSPDCRGALVCAGVEFDDDGTVLREGRCAVPSEVHEPCYPDVVEVFEGIGLNTSADGCFFGLVCDPSTRRCAHGPGPEEPCLAGRCEQDAYCDGRTCHVYRSPGQSCRSGLECFGACEDGVCAMPPANVACPAP